MQINAKLHNHINGQTLKNFQGPPDIFAAFLSAISHNIILKESSLKAL
jgi:hypothetical protein